MRAETGRAAGRGKGLLRAGAAALIALTGAGLLLDAAAVSEGVAQGLKVCAGVLIPSLFPMMVLSCFLALTDYARILSLPFGWITRRVFKLPEELGYVLLLSMVGGYPVGAKTIATLLQQKKISAETAERMLCFCVNSGPSFLLTAVGAGMLQSRRAGAALLFSQIAATLLIGAVVSARAKVVPVRRGEAAMKGSAAFVAAVSSASSAMIGMCAFAVLFSGIVSLLNRRAAAALLAGWTGLGEKVAAALLSGLLEVTTGCLNAAAVGGDGAFLLVSAFVSFGGLSVLFQVMSCFGGAPARFRPMVLSRFAHGAVSCCIGFPIYRLFCGQRRPVWSPAVPPAIHLDGRTIIITIGLLAMCSMLILSQHET